MSMFDPIDTSATGVQACQTWMDAISNNLANMNDTTTAARPAYQAEFPDVAAIAGGPDGLGAGVSVTGISLGPQGEVVSDPSNPLADKAGDVKEPQVDMAQQMTDLIIAQRAYQANVDSIQAAAQTYQDALGLKP
jgi:flagellar basal-body rod protein FlgC